MDRLFASVYKKGLARRLVSKMYCSNVRLMCKDFFFVIFILVLCVL